MRQREYSQQDYLRLRKFASRLAELMAARGLNQTALVAASGVTQTSLSRYLAARQEPRMGELIKLSRALDVRIEELVALEPTTVIAEPREQYTTMRHVVEFIDGAREDEVLKIIECCAKKMRRRKQ
jgi:transcriptional regulator with XRE-family HTH domain